MQIGALNERKVALCEFHLGHVGGVLQVSNAGEQIVGVVEGVDCQVAADVVLAVLVRAEPEGRDEAAEDVEAEDEEDTEQDCGGLFHVPRIAI